MSTCNDCESCDNPPPEQEQPSTATPGVSVVSVEEARQKLREATRNAHVRVKTLMAEIEKAKEVMMAGVQRTGPNSALVNFSRVGPSDWSPERFMPDRQVEAIVIAMRAAANGSSQPRESLAQLLAFAEKPTVEGVNTVRLKQVGSVSVEVAQAVATPLREWMGLLDQTRALIDVVAGTPPATDPVPVNPPADPTPIARKRCGM